MLSLLSLKSFIKRTSLAISISTLIIPSLSFANNSDGPVNRFGYNIDNGVDLYLAPNLVDTLYQDLGSVLGKFNINTNSYSLNNYENETGEKPLEEIITNQELLSSLKSLRSRFRHFFSGIRIRNNHNFEMKMSGMEINADWSELGLRLVGHQGNPNKLTAIFVLEARNISLGIESLMIQDFEHSFIGEIGGEKFYVQLNEQMSNPLRVIIPIIINYGPKGQNRNIEVKGIESNAGRISLDAGWKAPLKLPKIKVTVNNRSSYMRATEVEKTLKKELPNILLGLQQELEDYLYEGAPEMIQTKVSELISKDIKESFTMPIILMPDYAARAKGSENYPNEAVLGIKLNQIGMRNHHLRVQFDAFMQDGKKTKTQFISPKRKGTAEIKEKFLNGRGYDALASINIGIINRYLQISCKRGYLKNLELGSEVIELPSCPYVKANERTNELRLVANVTQSIDAWFFQPSYYAVSDPIVVRFEVGIKVFTTSNGKLGLKLTRIYPNTAFIAPQYINFGSDSAHKSARQELSALNEEYEGMIIMEELPIPTEYKGVSLKFQKTKVGGNGNLIFYLESNL